MNKILYEGKSKVVCEGPDENSVVVRYKDSATAFNGEKKAVIAGKGALNAAISRIIFGELEKKGVETHLLKVIDDTSELVKKSDIVMVEMIVRNMAAGKFSRTYDVPEGSPLRNTVVEMCLKSDRLGDPMINESQITALGLATKQELAQMSHMSLKINVILFELFEKIGIKLVDFKLEFGRFDGRIILCDEISPDSCRLWDIETNQKFDKDVFRQDLGDLLSGYREVLRRLQKYA